MTAIGKKLLLKYERKKVIFFMKIKNMRYRGPGNIVMVFDLNDKNNGNSIN